MREIKFRGREIELGKPTGRTVYGHYIVGRSGQACIATNFTAAYEVDPDSVAQLIGYDADGNEVYEDDAIANEFGGVITIRRVSYRENSKLKNENLTRKIKYRGRATGRLFPPKGKLVSGYLSYSFVGDKWSILFEDANHNWNDVEVEPDSIQQLVSYDSDGREVYEGDLLLDQIGSTITALMSTPDLDNCTLKETQ